MAVEAHCLLPIRGRGVVDPTETKQRHGDSMPHAAAAAAGPPVYVVPATGAERGAALFANAAASSRKRARGDEEDQFVGAANKRRVMDVHPAVVHHAQKMNVEVQRWRRYAAHVAAVADAAVVRQMRDKDEEINAARWLNWLLQEQVHAAHLEAQAWRDAAMSSEAAAAALRADLYHALCAQARDKADAESCCSGNNKSDGEGDDTTADSSVASTCHGCDHRDAAAVLLPPAKPRCG